MSWTLPDGRHIDVFDTDPDATTRSLQAFADSIIPVPSNLQRSLTVALAPKGFQLDHAEYGLFRESFSLCPAAQSVPPAGCLTIFTGYSPQSAASAAEIMGEGEQHAVSNGTLYLELTKNRAVLYAGTLVAEIDSGIPMTDAQFTAIAESLKATQL